uniref:Uncharacterized protein n=1 Tax=Anguilla anguilla TaxID=7936 RepID=A0A0E9UUD0_ANGAN
MAFLTLKT